MKFGFHVSNFLLVIAIVFQQPAAPAIATCLIFEMQATGESTAKYVGTDACVQCHKDGHRFPAYPVAGKEYAIWANEDPHSSAYNDLFNQQSRAIARNLKLAAPPHNNQRCLNCHVTNVPNPQLAANNKHTLVDGVGCESCHGPAEKWLVPHKLSDWKYWSPSQKESIGFLDTDNLAARTRKCVECHVGSDGRDVNHDLIAAGHPRLYFEMSAYQSNMPRHWSRAKDLNQNSATTESRLWLIGQLVAASASLDVLQQRVDNPKAPWPEFAEYSCVSCHHDLSAKRLSNDELFKIGTSKPAWGSWNFSMLENFSNASGNFIARDFKLNIGKLRNEMRNPLPDRSAIGRMSFEMRKYCNEMADFYSQMPLHGQDLPEIATRVIATDSDNEDMNWDVLTQRYLAAVAFRQSLIDTRLVDGLFPASFVQDSRLRLLEIRDTLKFIEHYDGPKDLSTSQKTQIEQSFGQIFHIQKN